VNFYNNNVLKSISKVTSYIFHPVFISFYIFLTLYYIAPLPVFYTFFTYKSTLALFGIILIYTAILPGLVTLWMKRTRFISDIEISIVAERPKVYLLISAFYGSLAYFLYSKGGVLAPTGTIIMIITTNIVGLAAISLFSKISSHVSALAAAVGIFSAIYLKYYEYSLFYVIIISLILTGWVGSARMYLGSHTLSQIIVGFIWGIITGLGGTYLFLV
jgi:membrane-associated phospholipid phosphatase